MRYVYIIRNLINNKIYVGQTKTPKRRYWCHFAVARSGNTRPLYASIRKHGKENFSFEVIEECADDLINEREQFWVAHFDSFNPEKGYNLTRGGDDNPMNNSTSAAKAGKNISKALTGRRRSKYERRRISEGRKGIKFSNEWRRNISLSLIGQKRNAKPIEQLTLNGVVVKRFSTIKEAALSLIGSRGGHPNPRKIQQAAKLNQEFMNFMWRFV